MPFAPTAGLWIVGANGIRPVRASSEVLKHALTPVLE
jgi:hypothetical protein